MNIRDATHQTEELAAGWGCLSPFPPTHTAAAEAASDTGLRLYESNIPEQNPAGLAQVTFTHNIDSSAISVKGKMLKQGKPSIVLAEKHFSKAFLHLKQTPLCGELWCVFKSIAQDITEQIF